MSPEVLDPDFLGGGSEHGPDRPVTQARPDLLALGDDPQERSFLELGLSPPGTDALLDPDWDGDGTDPAALSVKIGDDPNDSPVFALTWHISA